MLKISLYVHDMGICALKYEMNFLHVQQIDKKRFLMLCYLIISEISSDARVDSDENRQISIAILLKGIDRIGRSCILCMAML